MKKFVVLLLAIFLVVPALAHAVKVKLPNGQDITIDGMPEHERNALLKHLSKEEKSSPITIPNSPAELKEWSQLITGTIKDIASDLNVAVNDFVKTPAGLGISALIIYKVAGKDMLQRAWSFFIVPFWFIITTLLGVALFYFFKPITFYQKKKVITEKNGKDVVKYSDPKRTTRYPFASDEARGVGIGIIVAIFIANTIAALSIFF